MSKILSILQYLNRLMKELLILVLYTTCDCSLRCPAPSRHCNWLWPSWRPETSALLCNTVKRPSQRRREPSLTRRCSTSCIFPMTRSLPFTYHSSCPCVSPFCCHCSKSCLRFDRDAEKSKPRRTESKNHDLIKHSVTWVQSGVNKHSVLYDFYIFLLAV